jgi:predicted nucleic acid-binding protein
VILIDANILLYAYDSSSAHHKAPAPGSKLLYRSRNRLASRG